jgi:2-polyprenyl-6-methoxyphenol hydroxylase-like FAD-dependent oxidoreductase
MADVTVIGAGVAGLGTALALGRQGHAVTLLERDATPMPVDAHHAFEWDRRGAPQVRHSHAFLARLRNLLRDRYPDVLEALIEAGATEMRFAEMLPDDMTDRERRPGDEDLVALACRRTTFEWVLRKKVLTEDHVQLIDGVAVSGFEFRDDTIPTVTGVQLERGGSAQTVSSDLVVAANGRRSPLNAWLEPAGVVLPETEEDTGIIYLSRFYRLLDDATPPEQEGPIGGDLGYLKFAIFQGDNRTFSVTFATPNDDEELRRLLLDPNTFDEAARTLTATAPWIDPAVSEPITEVYVMAKLVNRLRSFVDDDRPRVLGMAAVGDAHTCTNPLYGRGCSLGMVQANLLADAFAENLDDAVGWSLAYERASAEHVEPWYHASVTQDQQSRRWVERERLRLKGEATDELDDDEGAQFIELLRHGLFPASRSDGHVFRAFIRAFNLLDPPMSMMTDPAVMAAVMAAYQERDTRPEEEPLGPPRKEMLSQITAA